MIYETVKPAAASGELGHKSLSLYARQGGGWLSDNPCHTMYAQGFFVETNRMNGSKPYALVLLWVYFKYQEIRYML